MKRIEEKVKDVVEVRSHTSLIDFAVDPLQTLTGYHFTEITAEMMAKWLAAAARVAAGEGVGLALAGFRGVGKSHFLAAFGALLAHPEFRSRVPEALVTSAAQGLARRSYPVAFVRRGMHPTLVDELKDAIAPIIRADRSILSDSISELLKAAADSAGDTPLVLLIDTALERSSRVARDDGALLSEIAGIAKQLGVFVGIALDDDISGADGINSSISRTFNIDYLDQEHLYRIVDRHIFPKNGRMQSVLHDIYDSYRTNVPGFRWSEDRFRSLYPLHPSIMEISPFVRLYMPEFALLGFAAEAGSRIMGRPADSLIAPDEVFDKVESHLRNVEALKDAFAAFDKINEAVVARTPVMKRLQAKLILKGLFLFSLNDEGTTASEIGASMLIFDPQDPKGAVEQVDSMLAAFAAAAPERLNVQMDGSGVGRYAFRIEGKDDFRSALQLTADQVPDEIVAGTLRSQMAERFVDCIFETPAIGQPPVSNCSVLWRGGTRPGKVFWGPVGEILPSDVDAAAVDWVAVIEPQGASSVPAQAELKMPLVSWFPSRLTADETAALKRFHVLTSDQTFRSEFHDHLAAAIQSHAVVLGKMLQRSMLDDGVLSIDGFEYNFTDEARSAQSLSQVISIMTEPLFEGRFPMHPHFTRVIGMNDVSQLVADLFGGAKSNLAETQQLAAVFGEPLGIVARPHGEYVPLDAESLRSLPLAMEVLGTLKPDPDDVDTLGSVFAKLTAPPYGLVREASHLLLAALVSARLVEFVTSNGDRINHRSLDLRLIWDDVVGIARPGDAGYTRERLVAWAVLLTGDARITSIAPGASHDNAVAALREWQVRWNERKLLARFDSVGDEFLNTRVWRLARSSFKSFVLVSDSVSAIFDGSIDIEGGLQLIAEAFSDSEDEFARLSAGLVSVEEFIVRAGLQREILEWLSLCEYTDDVHLDSLRSELDGVIRAHPGDLTYRSNGELESLWERFQREYSDHFVDRHEACLAESSLTQRLSELTSTEVWWEFENMSGISGFDPSFRSKVDSLVRRVRELDCRYDTREILKAAPMCGCPFRLKIADAVRDLPDEILRSVKSGLISFGAMIRRRSDELRAELIQLAAVEADDEEMGNILELADRLSERSGPHDFTDTEIRILARAFSNISTSAGRSFAQGSANSGVLDFSGASEELDALIEAMPG